MRIRKTFSTGCQPRSERGRRGTATVEFAVVLPVMVTLLLGLLEVGRLIQVNQIVGNAARVGGRMAASGESTTAQVTQAVTTYIAGAGLPTSSLTVTVTDVTSPGTDVYNAAYMDKITVTVSMPFSAVRWCSVLLVTTSTTQVTDTVTWYSGNSQVYPTTITAPAGF